MTANHRVLENSDVVLIERVKQTVALYDPRHSDFRSFRKDQLWAEVATAMGMSADYVRRRWTCLRDRYSRELKRMRKHPENDCYGKNDFFQQMDFLRKFVKVRRERRTTTGCLDVKSESSAKSEKYESSSKDGQAYENDENESECTNPEEDVNVYGNHKSGYEVKEAICTNSTTYQEYDEVEADEQYDDYVTDNQALNANAKLGNDVVPVLLSEPAVNIPATYTTKTMKCRISEPPNQQHPQQQQHIEYMQQHENPHNISLEDDYFSKSIAAYLRQLSRRNKIKAKVEMFQILEKYIELEENFTAVEHSKI